MNVQEILDINKKKREKHKENINILLSKIHKRIVHYAHLHRDSCTYQIPTVMGGLPVYDLEYITTEIFKKLDDEGYIATAYSDGKIEICWNEKLVEQKVRTDAYILSEEERKLRNVTRKKENVDKRLSFLANPKKVTIKEKTADELLDEQLERVLAQKTKQQEKYKRILKNKS